MIIFASLNFICVVMEDNLEENPLQYAVEDKLLNSFVDEIQKEYMSRCSPPAWLNKAEYPFKWLMSLHYKLIINCNIPDKLRDYDNQGPDYGFEKFCLLLAYLSIKSQIFLFSSDEESSDSESSGDERENKKEPKDEGSSSEAAPNQDGSSTNDKSDETLKKPLLPEEAYSMCSEVLAALASHAGDVMYTRIGAAMEHVLAATRAHMLYWQGEIAASQKVAKNITPITEMTIHNQAGIEGIKGRFILALYKDIRKALESNLKAKEMDPNFGAWPYQAGKVIRRLRREYKEPMVKEEVEYFEKAVELERNPKYLIFLAQAYQEMSEMLFKEKNTSEYFYNLQKKAAELYRESWNLQNNAVTICRRIGSGIKKLRGEYQDITLAKEALQKSIDICPSSVSIHQLGVILYKYDMDDEAALKCFHRVKEIYCTGEIIRVNLIRNPNYDPEDEIKYWRLFAIGQSKRDILYCDIGWYYLFFKNDLFMSAFYFWKVLKINFNSFRVMEYSSYAFCVEGPLNMIKVLVNEILLIKEDCINVQKKDFGINPQKKEDSTNTGMTKNYININVKGDGINTDMKDDGISTDLKEDGIKTDMKEDVINTDMKENSINTDMKENYIVDIITKVDITNMTKIQKNTFLGYFLQKVYEKHPDMRELKPRADLKQAISKPVERYIAFMRKKRYGSINKTTVKIYNTNWRSQEAVDKPKSEISWRTQENQDSRKSNEKFQFYSREENRHDSEKNKSKSWNFNNQEPGMSHNRFWQSSRHKSELDVQRSKPEINLRSDEECRQLRQGNGSNMHQQGTSMRRSSRAQIPNHTRYDITITDWRKENKSKEP